MLGIAIDMYGTSVGKTTFQPTDQIAHHSGFVSLDKTFGNTVPEFLRIHKVQFAILRTTLVTMFVKRLAIVEDNMTANFEPGLK